jgi:outer membrane protein OmpA-like peptidoglycan-associated protein
MKKLIPVGLALILAVTGCAAPQTKTGKGAAYGAGGGALAGAIAGGLIGGDAKGAAAGAALGALIGGAAGAGVGHMMDQQEAEYRQALAASEAASIRREGELLAITLRGDVTFDTNSATVRPGLYNEIERIAGVMVRYPTMTVMVEGFTDSTGSESYNLQLSQRRADAVRDILVARGVPAGQVRSVGYGESRPVASNATPEGRQKNRRVEIRIQPPPGAAAGSPPPAGSR